MKKIFEKLSDCGLKTAYNDFYAEMKLALNYLYADKPQLDFDENGNLCIACNHPTEGFCAFYRLKSRKSGKTQKF